MNTDINLKFSQAISYDFIWADIHLSVAEAEALALAHPEFLIYRYGSLEPVEEMMDWSKANQLFNDFATVIEKRGDSIDRSCYIILKDFDGEVEKVTFSKSGPVFGMSDEEREDCEEWD